MQRIKRGEPYYMVSAGRDILRFFDRLRAADAYAKALIVSSHPNIGIVRVERWDADADCNVDVREYGAPVGDPTNAN